MQFSQPCTLKLACCSVQSVRTKFGQLSKTTMDALLENNAKEVRLRSKFPIQAGPQI